MTAIAYLRRSGNGGKNGGHLSFEMQRTDVLALAGRHGDPEPELVVEWGKSGAAAAGAFGGTGRGGKRRTYHEMRERIAHGEVSIVYAYSLSRLARSTRELLELAEECAKAGTRIALAKEGDLDFASPHGRLYLTVLAAVSTFEAEVASERAHDRVAIARDEQRVLGEPPFGYAVEDGRLVPNDEQTAVRAVLDAYDEAGGVYMRAARLLNERGEHQPRRGGMWRAATVRDIVDRERGLEAIPRRPGSRSHPTTPLARLLYCAACGGMLTMTAKAYSTSRGPSEHRSWRCYRSSDVPGHPKPVSIPDHVIVEALRTEAARLRPVDAQGRPIDRLRLEESNREAAAVLADRRRRLLDAVEAGLYTVAEVRDRLDAITAEEAGLRAHERIYDVPVIEWTWEREKLAAVLGALWHRVVVDIPTRSLKAEWRVPEWRA